MQPTTVFVLMLAFAASTAAVPLTRPTVADLAPASRAVLPAELQAFQTVPSDKRILDVGADRVGRAAPAVEDIIEGPNEVRGRTIPDIIKELLPPLKVD